MVFHTERKRDMKFPTIHLNGTNGRDLLEQNLDVLSALRELQRVMQNAAPNSRDYYVQDAGAFTVAQDEHYDRVRRVVALYDEYNELVRNISEQNDAIETRKKSR